MDAQTYLASVVKGKEAIAEQRKETEFPNGDKIYVINKRHHADDGTVFYMEQRFVVIDEGTEKEEAYPMK